MPKREVKFSAWLVIYCFTTKRFLLAKRSKKVNNSKLWNFFGGNIDAHEAPVVAAAREASEEAGIDISARRLLHLDTITRSNRFMYFFLMATDEEFRPRINEENSKYAWLEEQEIGRLSLHAPTKMAIQQDIFDEVHRKVKRFRDITSVTKPSYNMSDTDEFQVKTHLTYSTYSTYSTEAKETDQQKIQRLIKDSDVEKIGDDDLEQIDRNIEDRKRNIDLKKLEDYFNSHIDMRKNSQDNVPQRQRNGGRDKLVCTQKIIRNGTLRMYYFHIGDELVANAGVQVGTQRLYNLWVNSAYRGQGYAKYVMNYLLENDSPQSLRADPYNHDPGLNTSQLAKFYQKFGFEPVYRDGTAIQMERRP